MRLCLLAMLTVTACKKGAGDQIKAAEAAAEADKPTLFCALAKKAGDGDVKDSLVSRFTELAYADVAADAPISDDIECIATALGALKPPPDITAELTRLHFKRPKAAGVAAQYAALPDKKSAVLDAWAHFGGHWDDWHISAPHAAPAMLAEIDKLGAAADPRFYTGLAGAYAYGDKLPPVFKERYAKLGADPKINDAWVQVVKSEDGLASEGHYTEGYINVVSIGLRELEARTGKLPPGMTGAVIRACGQPAAACTTSGKLDEESRKSLEYGMGSHENYDWSAKARQFVLTVKGGGIAPDAVSLALEELDVAQQQTDAQLRRNGTFEDDPPGSTDLSRPDPSAYNFAKTVTALVAAGAPAVPPLLEAVQKGSFAQSRAAARALAKLDPAALAKQVTEKLALMAGSDLQGDYGFGLGNALVALRDAHGDAATDVFLRLLSSFDPNLSGYATAAIKKRLERDKAIDALFRFMAAKDQYAQYEIDRYVDLVTSFGKDASPALVKNLEALLAAAGSPDKVFWAHKVVALLALQQVGTSAASVVVRKYSSDPGGYSETKQAMDENGKPKGPVQSTPRSFKELAERTLAKLG